MAKTAKKAARKPATRKRKASRPKGKAIVILSDGTGNSASAFFKTNIWRLYKALDLREDPGGSRRRQIAYYDDGVGTSSFRPLAVLGGAFGFGLKRNVLDLYRFVCRNFEDGDEVYVFGFSRGAFTVRVVAGLLAQEGILKFDTDEELDRYSLAAYRELRRSFTQQGWLSQRLLAPVLRGLRDWLIGVKQKWVKQVPYADLDEKHKQSLDKIDFVGVFDTVAAYGLPISELTRAVDNWIWPLSMPDYKLSPKVQAARHALALDDERDTFHPLVWDENEERRLVDEKLLPPGRMKQVWFNGMHADVGGGYPDDASAHVPLTWMLGEATKAGLRFDAGAVDGIEREGNAFAPLHNSRRGFGSYYRLQPRKLGARLDPPDPTTLIMQDPRLGGRGLLNSVLIHQSVLDRIRQGTDRAAPVVLPAAYQVVGYDGRIKRGPESSANGQTRAAEQETIWDQVWLRRVAYFITVIVTAVMVLLPMLPHSTSPPCQWPQCLSAPFLSASKGVLPGLAHGWADYYAERPFVFVGLAAVLLALMTASGAIMRRTHDDMRRLWNRSLSRSRAADSAGPTKSRINRLRSNAGYQNTLRALKWRVIPAVIGCGTLIALALLIIYVPIRLAMSIL